SVINGQDINNNSISNFPSRSATGEIESNTLKYMENDMIMVECDELPIVLNILDRMKEDLTRAEPGLNQGSPLGCPDFVEASNNLFTISKESSPVMTIPQAVGPSSFSQPLSGWEKGNEEKIAHPLDGQSPEGSGM